MNLGEQKLLEMKSYDGNIKSGTIIKGSFWSEPVKINLIEDIGGYVHIVGATTTFFEGYYGSST